MDIDNGGYRVTTSKLQATSALSMWEAGHQPSAAAVGEAVRLSELLTDLGYRPNGMSVAHGTVWHCPRRDFP